MPQTPTLPTTATVADSKTGRAAQAWLLFWEFTAQLFRGDSGQCRIIWGTGSPEGVETAHVSSVYFRRDGGAGTSFYIKESGVSNTGWVAK